jgi:hypothetical protein
LLVIFWSSALVLPWLLLVSACTLSLFARLSGKELRFGKSSKDSD